MANPSLEAFLMSSFVPIFRLGILFRFHSLFKKAVRYQKNESLKLIISPSKLFLQRKIGDKWHNANLKAFQLSRIHKLTASFWGVVGSASRRLTDGPSWKFKEWYKQCFCCCVGKGLKQDAALIQENRKADIGADELRCGWRDSDRSEWWQSR